MIQLTDAHIRCVRWIALCEKIDITHPVHLSAVEALISRDADQAVARMREPIKTSNEEATEIVE